MGWKIIRFKRFYWHRCRYQLCLWVISDHSACKKVTSLCRIFILITKQEIDASKSKNTHFYNMSVTYYFIMIHHSSQVIVMCLFSCLLGCFAQTNESSNPVTMTNVDLEHNLEIFDHWRSSFTRTVTSKSNVSRFTKIGPIPWEE